MKRLYSAFVLVVSLLILRWPVAAQPPAGYYDAAEGLSGQALKTALHHIIKNHQALTYSALWQAFYQTDRKPNDKVWDMYSDVPGGTPAYEYTFFVNQCGNYNAEGQCYNREHSWPASWFNSQLPMYTDLFHIVPTDGYVNNRRANFPYGEVNNPVWTSTNGSKLGPSITPGYTGTVFEPIDAYKGDFARGFFYMSVRYTGQDAGWAGSEMTQGAEIRPWAVNLLLRWHQQDPVSQKETDRNNAVYALQQNRNPFIDRPEFAALIWDPAAGQYEMIDQRLSVSTWPNPASDFTIVHCTGCTEGPVQVELLDSRGRLISRQNLLIEAGSAPINLHMLPYGFYLLRLNQAGQMTGTGKLLVKP
ncbi:MAG: endonuclease [Bacteroidetes bacterium]|nr:endonuclease [Bacteroidota bacterium]